MLEQLRCRSSSKRFTKRVSERVKNIQDCVHGRRPKYIWGPQREYSDFCKIWHDKRVLVKNVFQVFFHKCLIGSNLCQYKVVNFKWVDFYIFEVTTGGFVANKDIVYSFGLTIIYMYKYIFRAEGISVSRLRVHIKSSLAQTIYP